MKEKKQANNFVTNWWLYLAAVLSAVYIIINAFNLGGDTFVFQLNGNAANPLALVVTILAFRLASKLSGHSQNRLVWGGLALGWFLWTIAEVWWGIAGLIGQEVPFPSWADFFWLLGYFPIIAVMISRLVSLPRNFTSLQKIIVWVCVAVSLTFTVLYVLVPIIRASDPASWIQDTLNILYPVFDLILLLLMLQVLFLYQHGAYGRVWAWLSTGFIMHSIADLLFSYASTAGIYYPDGRVNLISGLLIDVPYNLAYLAWMIGLLFMRRLQRAYLPLDKTHTPPKLVPNSHFLIFTKADDTIINVSANFERVFTAEALQGKTIVEALGISPAAAANLMKEIRASAVLRERDCLVTTLSGQRQAEISGAVVNNPQGEYAGFMLLVRMVMEDYSLDALLTDYQKGMVSSLLATTGINEGEEVKQLLSNYYLAYIKSFYNRVYTEGGSILAEAFLSNLQTIAQQHKWQISMQARTMLNVSALSLAETRASLPVMIDAAKQSLEKITDTVTVDEVVEDFRTHFDEAALKNIAYFELREVGYSN